MANQDFLHCNPRKLAEYEEMVKNQRLELLKLVEAMNQSIQKASASWQDDVFMSIRQNLDKSNLRLCAEMDALKTQIVTRLQAHQEWLRKYKRSAL